MVKSSLFSRLPIWCVHALAGVAGLILLTLAFAFLPPLHEFDMQLAGWLRFGDAPQLDGKIVLIDVPKNSTLSPDQIIPDFRRRLGELLIELAANRKNLPKQIALDLWFDAEFGAFEKIIEGLGALHPPRESEKAAVLVHGALNVRDESGKLAKDDTKRHLMSLYERMDDVGHSLFHEGAAGPFYDSCLPTGRVAMPLNVGGKVPVCESGSPPTPRLVRLGAPLEQGNREQLLGFDPSCPHKFRRYGGDCLAAVPGLSGKLLIIGQLSDDRSPYAARSGPEIVAWAVNDLIAPEASSRAVLAKPGLHLALAFLMPVLALGLFVALLRFVRQWRLSPWRIALLAAVLALLVPLLLVLAMREAGHDYSQVLLPVLLTLLTLILAAHYRAGVAYEEERRRQGHQLHEHVAYDVFISYRRTHADWVEQNLLPILDTLRGIDGKPLRVFWDNKNLHQGNYNRQLEWAIHESRIFMPLLTPDYFDAEKKYCYWEMNTAWDRVPTGGLRIIPLLHQGYNASHHGHRDFPTLNTAMHGFSTEDPKLAEKLSGDILSVLSETT